MKNWSIRTRIIMGIITVNLIGMFTVWVYLHESYSGGLDVTEQKSATLGVAAWNALRGITGNNLGSITDRVGAKAHVDALKSITGAEYGLLLDKSTIDEASYASMVESESVPNNWDERDTYVLMASTDVAAAEEMQLNAAADTIPEIGKIVGVENGACSRMCHDSVEGEGDFWGVRWSKDHRSRGHIVFPIVDDAGRAIGIIYSIDDISAQADSARVTMNNTSMVITFGLIIATALVVLMLNGLVFKRLDRMMGSMEEISIRVAGGDFGAHFTPDGTTDEIGRFEQFFARFMDLVTGTLKSLTK